jgi:hypothetical protein
MERPRFVRDDVSAGSLVFLWVCASVQSAFSQEGGLFTTHKREGYSPHSLTAGAILSLHRLLNTNNLSGPLPASWSALNQLDGM